jgi:hypothetical protein
MGKIVYTRGTTYYLTVNYTAPTYLGTKVFFTAKNTKYDSDATDATNAIFTPKTASMSGSSFPQSVTLKISPGDVALTVAPSANYSYSVKVLDSNGDEYLIDSGVFVLQAITTNETS